MKRILLTVLVMLISGTHIYAKDVADMSLNQLDELMKELKDVKNVIDDKGADFKPSTVKAAVGEMISQQTADKVKDIQETAVKFLAATPQITTQEKHIDLFIELLNKLKIHRTYLENTLPEPLKAKLTATDSGVSIAPVMAPPTGMMTPAMPPAVPAGPTTDMMPPVGPPPTELTTPAVIQFPGEAPTQLEMPKGPPAEFSPPAEIPAGPPTELAPPELGAGLPGELPEGPPAEFLPPAEMPAGPPTELAPPELGAGLPGELPEGPPAELAPPALPGETPEGVIPPPPPLP